MTKSAADPTTVAAESTTPTPLWSSNFLFVCMASFLAYVNYALFNPTLPIHIVDLGGTSTTVGITYAAFSGASFLIRPFVGKLVDTGSPRVMFGVGSLLLALGSLPFLIPSIGLIVVGRAIQGIGWSGLNVGTATLIATLAPSHRRGEASGYYQTFIRVATGLLPPLGLWLLQVASFQTVVILAIFSASFSAMLALPVKVHRPKQVRSSQGFIRSLFEPSAVYPGLLLFLVNLAFPAAVIFIPLYARTLDILDVTIFFLAQGITGIVVQGTLGRLSDRIGRAQTNVIGLVLSISGLFLLSQAQSIWLLALAGSLYMFGFGIVNPTLMAMVIDRAVPARMGAATATYSLAFQMGNAVGAPLAGIIIAVSGYPALYFASMAPQIAALLLVLVIWRSQRAIALKTE